VFVKRSLAICVLALSVLGGCAATDAPAKAAEGSAKATEAPAKAPSGPELSKEDAKAAFLKVMQTVMGSPDMASYAKAVAAGDYKTARGLAPSLSASCADGPKEIQAVVWPAEIKDDMVTYASNMKDSCSQWGDLAATSTDDEAKKAIDDAMAVAKSNPNTEAAAAGKRIVTYLGLGAA